MHSYSPRFSSKKIPETQTSQRATHFHNKYPQDTSIQFLKFFHKSVGGEYFTIQGQGHPKKSFLRLNMTEKCNKKDKI